MLVNLKVAMIPACSHLTTAAGRPVPTHLLAQRPRWLALRKGCERLLPTRVCPSVWAPAGQQQHRLGDGGKADAHPGDPPSPVGRVQPGAAASHVCRSAVAALPTHPLALAFASTWFAFACTQLDADGSGTLDIEEIFEYVRALRILQRRAVCTRALTPRSLAAYVLPSSPTWMRTSPMS
jgi:hypothetical protein